MHLLNRSARRVIAQLFTESDAWWIDVVEDAFAFLGDYGYRPPDIRFHHEGSWVRYSGPDKDLILEFEPKIGVGGVIVSRSAPQPRSLYGILAELCPDEVPKRGGDRPTMESAIRAVAALLERYAAEVL